MKWYSYYIHKTYHFQNSLCLHDFSSYLFWQGCITKATIISIFSTPMQAHEYMTKHFVAIVGRVVVVLVGKLMTFLNCINNCTYRTVMIWSAQLQMIYWYFWNLSTIEFTKFLIWFAQQRMICWFFFFCRWLQTSVPPGADHAGTFHLFMLKCHRHADDLMVTDVFFFLQTFILCKLSQLSGRLVTMNARTCLVDPTVLCRECL